MKVILSTLYPSTGGGKYYESLTIPGRQRVPISACEPKSLEDLEVAFYQFQTYFGDPTETLSATLENDPGFVLGHIFNASAMLMMSERQYLPMVKENLEAAEALSSKSK